MESLCVVSDGPAVCLPGASERLANLRNLNSGMQLAETGKGLSIQSLALSTSASVTCRSSMLRGLPAECSQLVHSGLAFQVSVDVEKLDKSIKLRDVIELANGPINMFFMPHTSRCVEYLDRSRRLICEALKRCEVQASTTPSSAKNCDKQRLVVVFGLEDRIIPVALSSLARTLFIKVASKGLSFSGVIDAFGRLIPQMETSAKLCLLLTLFREFIRLKWPGTANDVDPAAFKELQGLLNWMFTSGAIQFNLTDSEEDNKNRPRGFLEQLETVEVGVNVSLLIVWLERSSEDKICTAVQKVGLVATDEVHGYDSQKPDMMGRLDTLREDMHIVKAKEKAVVDRVIRVHNRFLQDRWEKSFEGKVVKSRKKHVEYLLYGETLQFANEFQCIVAEGFPYLPGQSNHGCHGPVLLSNAIGLADVRRLQSFSTLVEESFHRGFQFEDRGRGLAVGRGVHTRIRLGRSEHERSNKCGVIAIEVQISVA
ncbi:hypothetical protein SELMODRAFT_421809 [Selaginella moellendorffii]|uniref:Uncharacterized protein n=1 Tax=Selaginella moellendorffii TaxID=88036 RepID=D8SGF3_SELML|nr:hypothetical protein SELMODRAFT_421809 [Selaginella moellendorffii]